LPYRTVGPMAVAVGLWLMLLAASLSAGEIYQYRRSDGARAFTDNPRDLPPETRILPESRLQGAAPPTRDLAAGLKAALRPRNPIEQAALATVAVKSGVGLGSGFFITANGLILTNKHVIRTPERERERRAAQSQRIRHQAETFAADLEDEFRRWQEAMADLESWRGRTDAATYKQNRSSLDRWARDLDRRRAELRRQLEAFESRQGEQEARARLNDLDRVFAIRLADDTQLKAHLVAVSDDPDLALLKIDGVKTPFLTAAPTDRPPLGQPVYAIGNPAALHNSVARGVVSGYQEDLIKTDAKIYPGNSGGPLVTEDGSVLGINTFKQLTERFEGLGFAISIRSALQTFARYLPDSKRQ
jgi:serine protease Do